MTSVHLDTECLITSRPIQPNKEGYIVIHPYSMDVQVKGSVVSKENFGFSNAAESQGENDGLSKDTLREWL